MKNSQIILVYHAIIGKDEKGKDFYCIPEDKFRKQMICVAQVTKSPSHQVTMTFDDGDITNYMTAYPILKELGLKAYFFILVSKVGSDGYMNWQQIKELKNNGMMIGSHGLTHRILTPLKDAEIEMELKDSKKILEENLAIPIKSLSIPRGFYNERIIQKAKELGYEAIFTSELGINLNSSYCLKRIAVRNSLSFDRFKRILEGRTMIRESVEEAGKKILQAVMGIERYERLTLKAYRVNS